MKLILLSLTSTLFSAAILASEISAVRSVDVFRLDGSRYLKVVNSAGNYAFFPAIGFSMDPSFEKAVCPKELNAFAEIIEIRRNVSEASEINKFVAESLQTIQKCKNSIRSKVATSSQSKKLKLSPISSRKPIEDDKPKTDQGQDVGLELEYSTGKAKK